GYLLNWVEALNQKTLMADMECDFTLHLKYEMKQEKEEIDQQNCIEFPCEKLEQVSQIKIEKTEWDIVGLKTESSKNHGEFSQ
ncbi:zinc finger protein 468, partial [Biomphalaria glabrata]